MKRVFLFLFLSFSLNGFGQISGIVKDAVSGKPIPYVNIWIKNTETGTSTDTNGRFIFNNTTDSDTLIFSAVGYAVKTEKATAPVAIYLTPEIIELPEVIVTNPKFSKTQTIDSFKRSQVKGFYGANDIPWIVAKFYPYQETYSETRFLKSIRFFSESKVKGALLNIRFYNRGKDGKPGGFLSTENVLVTVPKGRKIITVNLEEYHICIPENGFFIGFERLIIGKNRYITEYTLEGDKSKKKYFENCYAPSIGLRIVNSNANSWVYSRGNWVKDPGHPYYGENKYHELALELIITN